MSDHIQLELTLIKGNFDSAGEASAKVKRVLQQLGVDAAVIRRIAIGCYEAEMNVIIHSDGGKLLAAVYPNRTEITVSDDGPGIADIDLAMQEGYSTAPDYVRELGFGAGMGLPNMVKCADEFKITSAVGSGTCLYMVFKH